MDPRFYENDFLVSNSSELEFVHSPFYDLARQEKLNAESSGKLIDEVTRKLQYVEGFEIFLQPPVPTKENVAYTRYADISEDPAKKDIFQFPKGKPIEIFNKAELFRVQRWSTGEDKWAAVKRSKAYIGDKFFPPFELKEGNLRALFADKSVYQSEESTEVYQGWKAALLAGIPRINHDVLVQLSLHLAYDAKVNDKQIWRAIEDAAVASLHHMTITQVAQLEWATMELKPKHVTPRLNTLLIKRALETIASSTSADELIDVIQGFRQRKSKDMY